MDAETKELCPELWQENQRLKALVNLGRILADAEMDLDNKLQSCIEVLARLAGAERASLMLLDTNCLVVRAGTNEKVVGMECCLDEQSISTQVLRSGEPVYTKDIGGSDLADVGREGDQSSYRTGSLMSLPLTDGGENLGVLNLSDKEGAPHFDEHDLDLARDIAAQLSRLVNFSAMHSRLEAAYQDIRRTQKSKDDLMYLIFHEMKAPLTGVKEMLRLVGADGDSDPEEREHFLALAEVELELLWRRISNLTDINRMDNEQYPLNKMSIDLEHLVREVAGRISTIAKVREVGLELDSQGPAGVRQDEELVERIMVNLLVNALKFSSPDQGGGGSVTLKLSREDDWALIQVIDSGPGIEPGLGQGIFERNKQGQPTQGSSGLGLYFSRRAAWLLGGDIAYENLPQGGAIFTLRLPLEEEQ